MSGARDKSLAGMNRNAHKGLKYDVICMISKMVKRLHTKSL